MPPPRRTDARAVLFEKIRTTPPKYVHVTGVPYAVEREVAEDPQNSDHVWLTIEVPPFGRIRASVNTMSRLSREAGHDPRMRVGIVKTTYDEKPGPGLNEDRGQDYRKIEAAFPVTYEPYEPEALAELLVERGKKAVRVEVFGDLFATEHLGVRQIHCRRASSAVPQDIRNRDGALKLYYAEDNASELFLFKFDGQP
jgi:hypothetical protein